MSPEPPGPRRQADAQRRRRSRILDAAEHLFAQRGFDATPTAQIALEAQVPKGLVFYYFPKKIDILRTLLTERLPSQPLCSPGEVAHTGDAVGSLLRLARTLGLGKHESIVLRTIIFREARTHPEVGDQLRALREGLLDLTEAVLDAAAEKMLDPKRRRQAAHTFVSVLLDEASADTVGGGRPDLTGAAEIICSGLVAPA